MRIRDAFPRANTSLARRREEQIRLDHENVCVRGPRRCTRTVPPPVDPNSPVPVPQNLPTDTGAQYPIPFPYSPIAETSDGWTDFALSPDSKRVYVSTSGSDTNPGTINAPVKSVAKAIAMARDGFPDWILFERRGDCRRDQPVDEKRPIASASRWSSFRMERRAPNDASSDASSKRDAAR